MTKVVRGWSCSFRLFLALSASSVLTVACSVSSPLVKAIVDGTDKQKGKAMLSYGEEAGSIYAKGLEKMAKDNCTEAVKLFEKIKTQYPFTSESILSELRIADCDFKQQNYAQAAVRYKDFAEKHSTHPDVDYATFRNALSTYKRIPKDWFILPPVHERDQAATKEALAKFRAFVNSYPLTKYAPEAEDYIEVCMAQLAEHELYVARYYLKKKKFEGALARAQNVIDDYEQSGLVPEAMLVMGEIYLQAGKPDQARATFMKIVADYPGTHEAKQAKKYLKALK